MAGHYGRPTRRGARVTRYDGYDWDPDYLAQSDGPADEARDQGLRRLSMLTLHATGLSVVTAIGFATVFATTAHAQTGTAVTAKPSPGPATASGTPSPGPTPTHHKKKKTSPPGNARRGTGHVRRGRPPRLRLLLPWPRRPRRQRRPRRARRPPQATSSGSVPA